MSTNRVHVGTDVFELRRDMMDATSMYRPNVGLAIIDAAGHAHAWCNQDGTPATYYTPSARYDMPSIMWVKDGEEYYEEDDEPHDVGHNECRLCGEHIAPPYTADDYPVFVPGLAHCYINGVEVGREEFERRYEASSGRKIEL